MEAPTARVGFALAAALFAAGVVELVSDRAPAICAAPYETRALAGRTVAVGCEGGAPARAAPAGLRGPARLLFGQPLDPNCADVSTLEVLPGIGPTLARRIDATRREHPFECVADLERVRGIGPRTLARIDALLAVPAQSRPGRPGRAGGSGQPGLDVSEPAGAASVESPLCRSLGSERRPEGRT